MFTAEIEFITKNQEWSDFYRSLYTQYQQKGSLSDRQIEAIRRGMQKASAPKPVVDVSAIQALFDTATNNAVKKPIFRTVELTISKAPMHGRNPGALYVTRTEDEAYLGKIVDNKFTASSAADDQTVVHLNEVASDPSAEAIKYARKFSRCGCCGRTLRNPVSVLAVIGPICAENWGLEHLREEAAEEYARMQEEGEGL